MVTGVSSVCNIIDYDLDKYRRLVDELGEASLSVEAALDDLPANAEQHSNDIYNATRRTRDVENEEEQLLKIEGMLNRYQEQRARLTELASEDEETPNDAVDVGLFAAQEPFGLTSGTQIHYSLDQLLRTQHTMGQDINPEGSCHHTTPETDKMTAEDEEQSRERDSAVSPPRKEATEDQVHREEERRGLTPEEVSLERVHPPVIEPIITVNPNSGPYSRDILHHLRASRRLPLVDVQSCLQ